MNRRESESVNQRKRREDEETLAGILESSHILGTKYYRWKRVGF